MCVFQLSFSVHVSSSVSLRVYILSVCESLHYICCQVNVDVDCNYSVFYYLILFSLLIMLF